MNTQINLNLLRALHALLDTKSSSAAAKILNISQPAVSKQLNSLREHFNDPLLIRSGGSNELTPKAKELKGQVMLAMGQMGSLFGGQQFDPATSDMHFRIATSSSMVRNGIGTTVKKIHEEAPNVSISLIPTCGNIDRKIEKGEVDLYLGSLHINPDLQVETHQVIKKQVQCILSENHPLAISTEENATLTVEQINQYPEVIDRSGFSGSALKQKYFKQQGINCKPYCSAMEFGAATTIVRDSDALLVSAYPSRKELFEAAGITIRNLPCAPVSDIGLCWAEYWTHNAAHRWLRNHFISYGEKVRQLLDEAA